MDDLIGGLIFGLISVITAMIRIPAFGLTVLALIGIHWGLDGDLAWWLTCATSCIAMGWVQYARRRLRRGRVMQFAVLQASVATVYALILGLEPAPNPLVLWGTLGWYGGILAAWWCVRRWLPAAPRRDQPGSPPPPRLDT